MKLNETTVYVPTLKKDAPYEICSWDMRDDGDDWTVPETNATKEIGYFHTKEELTELLSSVFDAGNKRGWSGYPNTDNHTQPTKEQFIQSLFNTEE